RARLVTSGLVPGRNRIQVRYTPRVGLAPSMATFIETVRPSGKGSQVVSSPHVSHSTARPSSTDAPARRGAATPTAAVERPVEPTFLGTVVVDRDAIGPGSEPKKQGQNELRR